MRLKTIKKIIEDLENFIIRRYEYLKGKIKNEIYILKSECRGSIIVKFVNENIEDIIASEMAEHRRFLNILYALKNDLEAKRKDKIASYLQQLNELVEKIVLPYDLEVKIKELTEGGK